jgi:methylmalonyl-CoA epimerase
MAFSRIHHVGIAVRDLEGSLVTYQSLLGLTVTHVLEVPERMVRVAFLPVGDSALELVEPTSPDSPLTELLERQGEGVYHLALEVDDIKATLEAFGKRGVQLIDEIPRPGAVGRIAFVDPRSTHGVLLELVSCKVENTHNG